MIVVEHLTVLHSSRSWTSRSSVIACEDVSFVVGRGEAVALVGPSGSGKTSILDAILAVRRPRAGRILVDGTDYATADRGARRKLRGTLAAVFQDPADSLDPRMSVADIIAEPLRLQRVREVQERVREVLDEVRLPADVLSRRSGMLSGGQQQRVAIARALTLKPSVLILDEPVSSLDAELRIEILTLLDALRTEHRLSYLMVSHDRDLVARFVDRTISLRAGRLLPEPPPVPKPMEVDLYDVSTAALATEDVRTYP